MIKLLSNNIAVVPLENPEMIGHIIIPEIAKVRLNQGFIKYTGDKVKDLKVGDYVLYSGYTGTTTHIDGEGKLIILQERFVIALISRLPNIIVPGLYFKASEDDYFPANYEQSMDLLTQAYADNKDWRNRFNIVSMEQFDHKELDLATVDEDD